MAATTKHKEDKMNFVKMSFIIIITFIGLFSFVEGKITAFHLRTEYCMGKSFSPRCGPDEVILMTYAMYGRMRMGKCVDHGVNVGCQTDVLPVLESMCSNRESCSVNVHTDLKKNTQINSQCPLGMLTYLETDFECRKVLQVLAQQCRSAQSKTEVSNTLLVSSEKLAKSQCGSSTLNFVAKSGQRLNVSIIDFSWDETHDESLSCINYLEFRDVSLSSTTVCAGTTRNRHVITSTGNELTAVFHIQDPANQRFILQFEAIGCGDISPPEGTWVQRDGDETTLGCHSGKHTWTLTCQHNQWVGAVGSCGTVAFQAEQAPVKTQSTKVEIVPGMAAFAMVSVLLFISSSAFTIGVCVYSKRKDQGMSPKKTTHQQQPLIMHDNRTVNQTPRFNQNQSLPFPGRNNMEPVMTVRKDPLNERNSVPNDEQMYFNTTNSVTDSMYSDSVKYYVLENPKDPNRT